MRQVYVCPTRYALMITLTEFKKEIWKYYRTHKRVMPWRSHFSPYWVVVSELMLQQTQVPRVMEIFPQFVRTFPSFASLARAPRAQVLRAWQGLGYNRRAVYLHQIAQRVVREHKGTVPRDLSILQTFPGIGPNTAASICAFAFNMPVVFIETNIRTVFLHYFFKNKSAVLDVDILPLVQKTLDVKNPREWYWALMDYGTYIKRVYGNPNIRSKHHTKQPPFQGSNRQLRGKVLKLLLEYPQGITEKRLTLMCECDSKKLQNALNQLVFEGLITRSRGKYLIA